MKHVIKLSLLNSKAQQIINLKITNLALLTRKTTLKLEKLQSGESIFICNDV